MYASDSPSKHIEITQYKSGATRIESIGDYSGTDIQRFTAVALGSSTSKFGTFSLLDRFHYYPSKFFTPLATEINDAYSWHLYTSTYVCLRKLFENLVIELLRKKFSKTNIDLYYRISDRRFHDFSDLIDNLKEEVEEFKQYSQSLDQKFFDFLKRLRKDANRNAHSIDVLQDSTEIESIKDEVNHYISLVCDIIRKI